MAVVCRQTWIKSCLFPALKEEGERGKATNPPGDVHRVKEVTY